jgi:hypothetical protein
MTAINVQSPLLEHLIEHIPDIVPRVRTDELLAAKYKLLPFPVR